MIIQNEIENNEEVEDAIYSLGTEKDYDDEDISVEQLLMHVISKENLDEVEFDKKEFQKGLKDISYVCGTITGLMNVGICGVDALTYVINEHTFKNTIDVNKLVNEIDLAKTKIQADAQLIENEKRSI